MGRDEQVPGVQYPIERDKPYSGRPCPGRPSPQPNGKSRIDACVDRKIQTLEPGYGLVKRMEGQEDGSDDVEKDLEGKPDGNQARYARPSIENRGLRIENWRF